MLQFHKPLPPNQTEIYNSIKNYRCHFSSKNVRNQIFIAPAKFKFPALFSLFFCFFGISEYLWDIFKHDTWNFGIQIYENICTSISRLEGWEGNTFWLHWTCSFALHKARGEESAAPIHMQMCVQTESIFTAINFGSTFCGGKVERAPDFTALR